MSPKTANISRINSQRLDIGIASHKPVKFLMASICRFGRSFCVLQVLREIAPGRNRLLYLWGHLTAIHDAMLPLLGLRGRLHPEFDVAFVSNPDKSQAAIPSHEQVRRAWNAVNAELWKGFETMSWSDWLQRHSAVSEEDFAKDASRNRFAVLLSRTNHLSYHLGQAVLALK